MKQEWSTRAGQANRPAGQARKERRPPVARLDERVDRVGVLGQDVELARPDDEEVHRLFVARADDVVALDEAGALQRARDGGGEAGLCPGAADVQLAEHVLDLHE